jgi:hypothetical protein
MVGKGYPRGVVPAERVAPLRKAIAERLLGSGDKTVKLDNVVVVVVVVVVSLRCCCCFNVQASPSLGALPAELRARAQLALAQPYAPLRCLLYFGIAALIWYFNGNNSNIDRL